MSRWSMSLAIILAVSGAWLLFPADAWAGAWTSNFYCSGGKAVGQLYDASNGACPATMKFSNIFTFLICHTEQLADNLLGNMYCGIMLALMPVITAVLLLSVTFFGVSFTLGFAHISARDFQAFLLKTTFIYAFATQADLLIGLGYNLLVGGLRDGTAIAISALYTANGTPTNGLGVYGLMDNFLAQTLHFMTDAVGQTWDKDHSPCKNAIFAVMALMAVAFPPIFYISISILIRISLTFVRAVFGYIYSLVGITFLLTLAPFFLSFYLFKQTQSLFEKWLGYLVSFSLQLVIVFAFLAFVLSIKFDNISNSITGIVMPATQTLESTTYRAPWEYCTVCDFKVVDANGADMDEKAPDFIKNGKLACKDNPPKPISPLNALAPPPEVGNTEVANALLKFATHGLLSLLVLAYIVDNLIGVIPALGQTLAGGMGGSIQLVGGDKTFGQARVLDMPGGGIANTIDHGFRDGFNSKPNTVSAVKAGFDKAIDRLVTDRGAGGSARPNDRGEGAGDPSLKESFMSYLMNPQRSGRDDDI